MEFNSGVSMFLPDTIGLNENDFDEEDHEDIVHEQTNQNEIVELIMAAFEGHEEPSDGEEEDEEDEDDDESLNTSTSSHRIPNEHAGLNINNNNNTMEHFSSQGKHELLHRNHHYQQPLFSTPAVSTPPPLVPLSSSTDARRFDDHTQYSHPRYQPYDDHNHSESDLPFNSKNSALVRYQNPSRPSSKTPSSAVQYFDALPTIDLIDPMQAQFMYQTSTSNSSDTQNQLNKFRILCNVKDRKITELENRCGEYHEKYNSDIRVLKHKIELSERAKYDSDQRYQSITGQCEELIQSNNQLQRTIKDLELRNQQLETNKTQLEKKLDEAESLIDSLHRKVNELQRFESVARTQQDCEMILASNREKHEQEILTLNEKLQMTQMNFQEKTSEVDELRVQLDSACRVNEKAIFERMETINHLNQQLHDCQKQYSDLITNKSNETFQQLTRMTEDKEKLEQTCEELQSEIRTLRDRLGVPERELNNDLFAISNISTSTTRQVVPHNSTTFEHGNDSLLNENEHLKERIDEFASNEKNLIDLNEDLQRQIQDLTRQIDEFTCEDRTHINTVAISNSVHMEQIQALNKELEQFRKSSNDLQEKSRTEREEFQRIITRLREDIIDLDKTKQLYIDVCQEKNSIEDKLRSKFENEMRMKLDDLRRSLEKDHHDKLAQYKSNSDEDLERYENQSQEQNKEIERMKINHEKSLHQLNIELDRLRANDDAKTRLIYVEKEFEQLKQDYTDLNRKEKESIKNCRSLEEENQNLLQTIEQLDQEKQQLRRTIEHLDNEKRHLNESQTKLTNELAQTNLDGLQTRINNYENAVSQYEEYRLKLETNLQKITQQRDTLKMDLRLSKEMLSKKETEHHQLEQRFEEVNRALSLADSHLQEEIEKIKNTLEQEYNRRYDRDQKQLQLLNIELDKQKSLAQLNSTSAQDIEEVKKMYRTEIDRLYRENIELSQNQAKMIDEHQKQLQIMKKDLEDHQMKILEEVQSQQIIEQMKKTFLEQKLTFEQDYRNREENLQNRLEHLVKLLEQSNETLNEERMARGKEENEYQQTISSLQKKIADMIKQHTKAMDEIKRDLNQERLSAQKRQTSRPICVPEYVQTDLSLNEMKSDYMATVDKLRELFTIEMLALLRLTCKMIFDVHHRVGIAHYMDNLDISIKKQIQNELARSRNSMIKEIRRELFEKMTFAMRSQGVPDTTIDMHVFELDRLLSQMAQDCLDSLTSSTSSTTSIYSTISSHSSLTTPQRQLARSIIYESTSSSTNLSKTKTPDSAHTPLRKSIECLYTTPKQAAPLAPHVHSTLDTDRRPKSASTILLASQSSTTPTVLSPRTHKFQRPTHRNLKMKMFRSEDDIMLAMQRQEAEQQQHQQNLDLNDDADTITLCENPEPSSPQHPPLNVRALARQFEQKTGSLPEHTRSKLRTPDQAMHYATARTIINEQQEENDDEECTWPQPIPQTNPNSNSNSSSGIKKFVRNGFKLFNNNKTKKSDN